jgi:preprotein translocase subunit SecY
MIYGLSGEIIDYFGAIRAILAGEKGSIVHLGIMPIVDASIIMQLLAGAKIINLDLSKKEDKAIFQGTQKILIVVLTAVMAIAQVGALPPDPAFVGMVGSFPARAIIILQLFMGGILIFLMDEIVSKWGIGSGISLFIVAGVSQSVIVGLFSWFPEVVGEALGIMNPPVGAFLRVGYLLSKFSLPDIVGGGFEYLFMGGINITGGWSPNPIVALLGTVFIFLLVIYFETRRIEIPLAHGKVRGARGRFPIRLLYASVIPVILVSVLLTMINMITMMLWTHPNIPLIGGNPWIGEFIENTPVGGAAWYLSPPRGLQSWLIPMIAGGGAGYAPWQYLLHIVVYSLVMIGGSILFAKFWIETTGMGAKDVAKQIRSSEMQIPGFRSSPRVVEKVLSRYIPPITVLSGAIVGGLAVISDLIGTVGGTSGTGVLLAVSILMSLYEAIAREQAVEMHPMIRKFFGVE